MNNNTKQCSKCKVFKPKGEFHVRRGRKSGLSSQCKECSNTARNLRNKENPESRRVLKKAEYERFKAKIANGYEPKPKSDTKKCPRCKLVKLFSEFHKNKLRHDGHDIYCKSCSSEVKKQDREANPEKFRARSQRYIEKHGDIIRLKEKARRKANPEPYRDYYKQHYQKNKATIQAKHKEYYQNNPHVFSIRSVRRRAREANLPSNFTARDKQIAINYFNGCCAVCGRQLYDLFGKLNAAMDHWIPISADIPNNPGTVPTNLVPLCHGETGCNNRKASRLPLEWLIKTYGARKAKQIATRVEEFFEWRRKLDEGD